MMTVEEARLFNGRNVVILSEDKAQHDNSGQSVCSGKVVRITENSIFLDDNGRLIAIALSSVLKVKERV